MTCQTGFNQQYDCLLTIPLHISQYHQMQMQQTVPFKKTDGVVGFRADGAYMFTPFEV
jgi:hypothetical protein